MIPSSISEGPLESVKAPLDLAPQSGNVASAAALDNDEYVVSGLTNTTILILSGARQAPACSSSAVISTDRPIPEQHVEGGVAIAASGVRVFDVRGGERDIRIMGLTDCIVLVRGVTRALRVDNLLHVALFTGPIAGSVLLHGATSCDFMLAARQVRIHTSSDSTFYLDVRSRPIIEGCTTLSFAPYRLRYDGWDADARVASLNDGGGGGTLQPATSLVETSTSMWCAVDDFGWHRYVVMHDNAPGRILHSVVCCEPTLGRNIKCHSHLPTLAVCSRAPIGACFLLRIACRPLQKWAALAKRQCQSRRYVADSRWQRSIMACGCSMII